jgi:hypothetical protein
MADELENQLSRAEKLLKERLTRAGKIARETTEAQFKDLISTVNDFLKEGIDDISESISKSLVNYNKISQANKNFGESLKTNLSYLKDNPSLISKLNQTFKETDKLSRVIVQNQEDLITGELTALDVAKDLARLSQNELTTLLAKRDIEDKIKELENEITTSSEDQKENLKEQLEAYQKINEELKEADETNKNIQSTLEEQFAAADKIDTKVGIGGKILKGLDKIPGIGKLLDFGTAEKAMRAMATSGAGGFQVLSAGAKALGPSLKAALGPLGLILMAVEGITAAFKFIKDAMFAADKQAVSLQRNLNLSQKEAYLLRDYFSDIKNDLETQYKLTAEIINAQSELSELSSLSNLYSKEALDAQIQLTKEYKLGADESSKLNKLFILNNAQGTKGLDIALEEVAAYANQNKILFNGTKILKEISITSGQILVSFRGSTEALTQAVLKSQKLGINLSSARDISKSLLNFEESISKELEAELLVGKDLNFERARSLALEGKFADAAEEVFKTVGGINEFEKLNVIQQEALAAAAGMTVDQFADALLTQKFIGTETGNQIKRLREAGLEEKALALARGEVTAEQLKESLKQLDAQEKFNVAIAEAKEIFTNLVKGGILQGLADTLKDIVESLGRLGYGQGAKEEKAEASVKEVKTALNSPLGKALVKAGKIKVSEEERKQLESMEAAVKNRTTGVGRFLLDFLDSALPRGEFRKEGRIAEDIVSQQASIKLAERTNQLLEQIAREGKNIYIDSNKVGTAHNMATTKT